MEEMITLFNRFDQLLKYDSMMVEAIGDCPNVEKGFFQNRLFGKAFVKNQDGTAR